MSIVFLVRHAHADWIPDENRPLSAEGHKDALRVADILHRFPITTICSSPARRARQTIEPLATRLGLHVRSVSELQERRLCGSPVDGFLEAVRRTWADPSFAFPGGEPNCAAQRRGVAVLRRLLARHPTEHLVLATHGNLLALLLQHFDPSVDFVFWKALTKPDIYELNICAEGRTSIQRLWQD